ncbi:hypothetical protein E5347_00855 [Clostridium sartagoforme]|uniref:Uncharacterized protein n=1 Tax=Clostridium sartagoforme TaxID=84031 RepID=A0A4S2DM86_9CLOT|nr:hypothetical protein [Clostridium sartagoforme]TGY43389.1 hypothetical protein E5347_00855 [Clostridium sartagoforme]
MNNLYYLNDEILSFLELKEDIVFHKIPKNKIRYFLNEASNIGRKEAKKYKDITLEKLLKDNGVEVIIEETCPTKKLDIRGEIIFDKKEKKITIYKNSIDQLYKSLNESGFKVSREKVYQIHLAHEFYHFLEFKNKKNTNELLEKVETISIGPIKRKSSILKTREIAAHSFCKELLNLKFHPKLMDYLFLIETKKVDKNDFKRYITELNNEYLHL